MNDAAAHLHHHGRWRRSSNGSSAASRDSTGSRSRLVLIREKFQLLLVENLFECRAEEARALGEQNAWQQREHTSRAAEMRTHKRRVQLRQPAHRARDAQQEHRPK